MVGNKSNAIKERRGLLRGLFEGHGYSLEQLHMIAHISLGQLRTLAEKEFWEPGCCVLLPTDQPKTSEDTAHRDLTSEREMLAASMAGASRFLRQSLDQQTGGKSEPLNELNKESRVKEIVSITKAIQVLEGLIINMETSKDDASLFPQDTLEFHRLLTKQITNLADGKPAP